MIVLNIKASDIDVARDLFPYQGEKVKAIKHIRECARAGLREAKLFCEAGYPDGYVVGDYEFRITDDLSREYLARKLVRLMDEMLDVRQKLLDLEKQDEI